MGRLVASIGEMKNGYKILLESPKGRDPLRGLDNIKMLVEIQV
jgi:hypothetical protein